MEVIADSKVEEGTKNLAKSHLMDRLSLPVVAKEQISVKEILHTPVGETVLDMGQNFAGFVEFDADLPKGTKVVLDFGEILQNDNFYRGKLSGSQIAVCLYFRRKTGNRASSFYIFRIPLCPV